MIDNYLPMYDIAKEKSKKDNRVIDNKINEISQHIAKQDNHIYKKNFIHSIISKLAQSYYKKQKGDFDKKFYITDKCNSCGICEKVCAFNNIKVEGKPEFQHKCEQCMACINLCPQNAIHLKKEKSSERFINSNVKLAEIMESNNIKNRGRFDTYRSQ